VLSRFVLPESLTAPRKGFMDKKAKKKIEVLRQKIQKTRQQLSGARQQDDEPGEVQRLEQEIADYESQVEKFKQS